MSDVKETTASRHADYGPYWRGTELRAAIMAHIRNVYFHNHGVAMSEMDAMMILDIVNKLSRLATTPRHIDSWHDIQGYAARIEEYLTTGDNK